MDTFSIKSLYSPPDVNIGKEGGKNYAFLCKNYLPWEGDKLFIIYTFVFDTNLLLHFHLI